MASIAVAPCSGVWHNGACIRYTKAARPRVGIRDDRRNVPSAHCNDTAA